MRVIVSHSVGAIAAYVAVPPKERARAPMLRATRERTRGSGCSRLRRTHKRRELLRRVIAGVEKTEWTEEEEEEEGEGEEEEEEEGDEEEGGSGGVVAEEEEEEEEEEESGNDDDSSAASALALTSSVASGSLDPSR